MGLVGESFNLGNDNKQLINKFMKNVKVQDREDVYYNKRDAKIYSGMTYLLDLMNLYKKINLLGEEDCVLNDIMKKEGIDKDDILYNIEYRYLAQLCTLKNLGEDISDYPKSLEDKTE